MKKSSMLIGLVIFALLLSTAALTWAQSQPWLPWRTETIRVGNERDGFHDTVEVRRRMSDPAYGNGLMKMPYLAQVPDEKRLMLMVHCGVTTPAGAEENRVFLMESTDEGENWSAPHGLGEQATGGWGLTCCGNGVMIAGNGLGRSTDGGRTWRWLPLKAEPRFGKLVGGWDPCFVFPDGNGRHLLAMGFFQRNFELPEAKLLPILRESHDAGVSWSPWRGIPEFPGVSEITVVANGRGELVAAMRATTLMAPSNDNSDRLEYSISSDNGATWTPPKVVAGNGRHHPSMALLPDGRIVMTYVVRMGYPDEEGKYAYGVEAVVSPDGGHTWDTDHRYLLAHWTSDCVVANENGLPVRVERFWAAPKATSTVWLPESGELLTAYGTGESIRRKAGDDILPQRCALVKWRPLESYSTVRDAPPSPMPAEKALQELRANRHWLANYDARTGLPDAGWINRQAEGTAWTREDGWLCLDHRSHTGGGYSFRGTDMLDCAVGAVGMRTRLNVTETQDAGYGERLCIYAVVGSGRDKFDFFLDFDAQAQLCDGRPFGRMRLPTRAGTPFLLEAWLDPCSRTAYLWIDGQLAATASMERNIVAPEYPCRLWFGRGTPRIGGMAEVAEFRFGVINNK